MSSEILTNHFVTIAHSMEVKDKYQTLGALFPGRIFTTRACENAL